MIPCSYWASTCIAALPSCMTLYEISVRQTRDLPVVSLFPHPASFRFHLTMDTLAFGYILPTTGWIRDFNPLETCAAGRTIKKSRYSVSYLLFYLSLILNNFLIFLPLALWMSYLLIPINLCNLILKALRSLSLTLRSLQLFLINALLFSSLYCIVLCILYLCFIFYQINFGESICSIIF